MSVEIEIEPDPARPLGGYARLILPQGTLAGSTTSIVVYEMFKERFLGEDGWQPTEAPFGPYSVNEAGGRQEVLIGPEIVNHLAEFAPVRLSFGSVVSEVTWPDTISDAPNAPPIGQILGGQEEEGPTGLSGTKAAAVSEPTPQKPSQEPLEPPAQQTRAPEPVDVIPEPEPVAPEAADPVPDEPVSGGFPWLWVILGLAILAAAGAGAYYYLEIRPDPVEELPMPEETEPEVETVPEKVTEPEPETDPCTDEALSASAGSFPDRLSTLRTCGGAASADAALSVLEDGLDAGDPQALLIFGHLYNPDVTDAEIEGSMGLSFADQPEVAIDYYIRARDAGAADAEGPLAAACESLRAADPSAAEDLCE